MKLLTELEKFIEASDFLTAVIGKHSLEHELPIELIALLSEKKRDYYIINIWHHRFNKMIISPLKEMFEKSDGLHHRGYEVSLQVKGNVQLIHLPYISTIDDFQNILTGFSIGLSGFKTLEL